MARRFAVYNKKIKRWVIFQRSRSGSVKIVDVRDRKPRDIPIKRKKSRSRKRKRR